MWVLPKGVAFLDSLDLSQAEPPKLLAKLRDEAVTGYAHLRFDGEQAYFLFLEGRLVDVVCESGGRRLVDLPAIARAFELACSSAGLLDAYRIAPDLARALHGLFHGAAVFEGQNLALIDTRALLAKVKSDRLTGALRVYSGERSGLIFFHEGSPLGFFHDGSETISTSAEGYQKIASLPGTKVDLHAFTEVSSTLDLLTVIDLQRLWSTTRAQVANRQAEAARQREAEARRQRDQQIGELDRDLRSLLAGPLGNRAGDLVDRFLASRGGNEALGRPETVAPLLDAVDKAAKLLLGASAAAQLKAGVAGLLAERQSAIAALPSQPNP